MSLTILISGKLSNGFVPNKLTQYARLLAGVTGSPEKTKASSDALRRQQHTRPKKSTIRDRNKQE